MNALLGLVFAQAGKFSSPGATCSPTSVVVPTRRTPTYQEGAGPNFSWQSRVTVKYVPYQYTDGDFKSMNVEPISESQAKRCME